jgi:SAM-dependent methyltransferase
MTRSEINAEFLDPPCRPDTMAFHSARTALFSAVKEVAPLFRGRVLDLACGGMPYREMLMCDGRISEYIGVDLPPNPRFATPPDLVWDGLHIPLSDSSIDAVLMTEFLEHHADPEIVLREVHRVLRSAGFAFATVPFIWNLHELPHDEYRYTPFSLERHFRNAGFSELTIKALGGWNRSFAQMIGLWVQFSGVTGLSRAVLKRIFFPFYKLLIRTDHVPEQFDGAEGSMFSGLSMLARKSEESE